MSESTDSKISEYSPSTLEKIKDSIANGGNRIGHIFIFIGSDTQSKKEACDTLKQTGNTNFKTINAADIVGDTTEETENNIEYLFEGLSKDDLMYIQNGENISGIYTGYSQSKIRYATPHVKLLLTYIGETNTSVIFDFHTADAVDETLLRASSHILVFDGPDSILGKALHTLRNFSFHGHNVASDRPDKYVQ